MGNFVGDLGLAGERPEMGEGFECEVELQKEGG